MDKNEVWSLDFIDVLTSFTIIILYAYHDIAVMALLFTGRYFHEFHEKSSIS